MKNILTLLLIFFLLSMKTHAQTLDTLNYVRQFEINKSEYINKPFSFLLNQMTLIQPKTINSLTKIYGKNLTAFSDFRFCSLKEQKRKSSVYIIIYWKNPISHSEAFALSKQNGFNFTNAEKTFYGDKIVGDIKVY